MGYRVYLAKMPKVEAEQLKKMDYNDVVKKYQINKSCDPDEDLGIPSPYEIATTRLYELGKYVELENTLDKTYSCQLLNFPEAENYLMDYTLFEITKDGFKFIIDDYSKKNETYFKNLYEQISILGSDMAGIETYFRSKVHEWARIPYDLDSGDEITTSWSYEYAVFELVRLFKMIDWDNESVIFYGY